jgi:hypothetical protein
VGRPAADGTPGCCGDLDESGGVLHGGAAKVVVEIDESVRVGVPGVAEPLNPGA